VGGGNSAHAQDRGSDLAERGHSWFTLSREEREEIGAQVDEHIAGEEWALGNLAPGYNNELFGVFSREYALAMNTVIKLIEAAAARCSRSSQE
jgi:hypothetical protein